MSVCGCIKCPSQEDLTRSAMRYFNITNLKEVSMSVSLSDPNVLKLKENLKTI